MSEYKNLSGKSAIDQLRKMVEAENICLFTTRLGNSPLDARPMATASVDEEGNIWFISKKDSEKNRDIQADNKVQLFYSNKSSSEYLSVYGEARITDDRDKIDELWKPLDKAWFEKGKEDPQVSLICVTPHDAHYWDTKNNRMISLIKIMSAALTGKTADDGVEGKMKLNPQR